MIQNNDRKKVETKNNFALYNFCTIVTAKVLNAAFPQITASQAHESYGSVFAGQGKWLFCVTNFIKSM